MAEPEAPAFADTNVLVYHVGGEAAKKQQAEDALVAQPAVVISAQVVAEFVNVCLKKRILSPDETRNAARRYMEAFRLGPNDSAVLRRGLTLHERYGLQWGDALVVAAAVEAGCPTLYSEDLQENQELCRLALSSLSRAPQICLLQHV